MNPYIILLFNVFFRPGAQFVFKLIFIVYNENNVIKDKKYVFCNGTIFLLFTIQIQFYIEILSDGTDGSYKRESRIEFGLGTG